jgi:hypothetical protein
MRHSESLHIAPRYKRVSAWSNVTTLVEGRSECGLLLKSYCESLISCYIFSDFLFLVQFPLRNWKKKCSSYPVPLCVCPCKLDFEALGRFQKEIFMKREEIVSHTQMWFHFPANCKNNMAYARIYILAATLAPFSLWYEIMYGNKR